MSGLDNLMQIEHDILKARDLIGRGILGEISFHIMNSKTDGFQLLTPGQLQKIQNAHPKKVSLNLEPSNYLMRSAYQKLFCIKESKLTSANLGTYLGTNKIIY